MRSHFRDLRNTASLMVGSRRCGSPDSHQQRETEGKRTSATTQPHLDYSNGKKILLRGSWRLGEARPDVTLQRRWPEGARRRRAGAVVGAEVREKLVFSAVGRRHGEEMGQ